MCPVEVEKMGYRICDQAIGDPTMDQSQPKSSRFRFRLNTLLFLIIISALIVQLYLQTSRLQQSRAREEVARAEAIRARILAEAAAIKAVQAQAAQATQPAAAPLPQTNSNAPPK
jgi:hypothetical protein